MRLPRYADIQDGRLQPREDVRQMEQTMHQQRGRRALTDGFRLEVVERCRKGDRSAPEVARELDLTQTAVRRWVREAERAGKRIVRRPWAQEDQGLTERVQAIFAASRQTYGSPRVYQALCQEGTRCSPKRVASLMGEQNLQGQHRPLWKRATADAEAKISAEDLIGRQFQSAERDVCWAADISCVRTWEGWMYLAGVIDLASRRVVRWAMANHMHPKRVCGALRMATAQRRPKRGLIFQACLAAARRVGAA